ncbi:MAG: DNA polymerase III subunit delta [Sedimentisphaerales bacterium]|nr:DNA polymerase III subunit delta [Sedimentisphaerales bacterium]
MAKRKSSSGSVIKPVCVIAGKETSVVNIEYDKLLNRLLEPQQRQMALFVVEPGQTSIAEILDELRTVPMFGKMKVVVIKNADDFISENRPLLEKYFDKPSDTGILVLTVKTWPSRTKLAKKLDKVGMLLKVIEPKAWQLPSRLAEYAHQAHSKILTKAAAELLIELSGDNLPRLYSEIDKLASFAYEDKSITPKHIELLIGRNRLFNAFAVIDAAMAGNSAQAVNRLRSMFENDRSAEYTALGAFAFHFRRMFNAKVLLQKGISREQVAKQLHIWSNKGNFFTQVDGMTFNALGSVLQRLAKMDFEIKTGRANARVAIEQLVLLFGSSKENWARA